MVRLNEIEKILDEAISTKGLMVVKCKPSYRPSVLEAFHRMADQYGFTIKSYKDKDIYNKNAMVTLYDPVHHTGIEFSKDFINENLIDFQNTGKKKINIEDIFSAYDQLPDKCKDATGLIQHTVEEIRPTAIAWNTKYDEENNELATITMPSYYINKLKDTNGTPTNEKSYELVLAHESMHSRDYGLLTEDEKNVSRKEMRVGESGLTESELELYKQAEKKYGGFTISDAIDWRGRGEIEDFDAFDKYLKGYFDDRSYITGDTHSNGIYGLMKASDYGTTMPSENYAEFGAMVITGYKNPTNPNSRIIFNGEPMQYQEWARIHPYTVQTIVKDLYDEEPSIDDILADTVPTRYGEFGVKIEDLK